MRGGFARPTGGEAPAAKEGINKDLGSLQDKVERLQRHVERQQDQIDSQKEEFSKFKAIALSALSKIHDKERSHQPGPVPDGTEGVEGSIGQASQEGPGEECLRSSGLPS